MLPININLPAGFLEDEAKVLIVPRKRKEVWAVAIDLVMQLDRVCKKYGIKYFADGGTVLGAVRHRGFVPWDDDLDVIMDRREYQRLCEVAPREFKHPYFFQTNETDPGSARGHAQLRNSDTTGILKSEMRQGRPIYRFNQGLFIDIFPFDNIPDDLDERKRFLAELQRKKGRISRIRDRRRIRRFSMSLIMHPALFKMWIENLFGLLVEKISGRDLLTEAVAEMEVFAQKFNTTTTAFKAPISFKPNHREVLPSHFFDEVVEVDFEFVKLPVLKNHLQSLEINYGNWREHVVGASVHGGLFVDVNHPYTYYLDDNRG